jgi:hypothetical protein
MIHRQERERPSASHPLEDEVEQFEEAEIVPGELDTDDLLDELADEALEEELLQYDELAEEFGITDEADAEDA